MLEVVSKNPKIYGDILFGALLVYLVDSSGNQMIEHEEVAEKY